MVQSLSLNGDGKVLHFTLDRQDSMPIGFHVFGNQVTVLSKKHRLFWILDKYWWGGKRKKKDSHFRWVRSPSSSLIILMGYAYNTHIFFLFLQMLSVTKICCSGWYSTEHWETKQHLIVIVKQQNSVRVNSNIITLLCWNLRNFIVLP